MCDVVVFGGTTEGREVCEYLQSAGIAALACVATEYGEALLREGGGLRVRTGRLDADEIRALLLRKQPRLVVDATHPYARLVSENVASACAALGIERLRVLREEQPTGDCVCFADLDSLVDWLDGTEGNIFVATGAKDAAAFARVHDFERRVTLRLLPSAEGLAHCLSLGYPAAHLICMQGPFSRALNAAMFRAAEAQILVTKESGAAGGFAQKIEAAQDCGMRVALLQRPAEHGVALAEALRRIEEAL